MTAPTPQKEINRLDWFLDIPEFSYFSTSYIYAALSTDKDMVLVGVVPREKNAETSPLSPQVKTPALQGVYQLTKSLKESAGVFLNKESARPLYHTIASWAQENKIELFLFEYKNDRLKSCLCISKAKPELRAQWGEQVSIEAERLWLARTAPKKEELPKVVPQPLPYQPPAAQEGKKIKAFTGNPHTTTSVAVPPSAEHEVRSLETNQAINQETKKMPPIIDAESSTAYRHKI